MFQDLDTSGMEKTKDSLGGGSFIKESGIYDGVIKYAYETVSEKGAKAVAFEIDIEGTNYRETVYVTSNKEKGCKPYSEKNGKKTPLPGFSLVDSICLIAANKSVTQLSPSEDKTIMKWDFDAGAEKQASVKMIMELVGKKIKVGILKKLEFKREQKNGEWVDTAETRESNVMAAVFHPEQLLTVSEAREGVTEPVFYGQWLEKWKGVTDDRTKGKGKAGSGTAGRPQSTGGGGGAAKSNSLFGDN